MKLIKNRIHHWSCSKFADLIRGQKKPYALEWGKWDEWDKEQKKIRPWRFWLSDTVLPKIQNIVYFPYDAYNTVKTYIRNRYFDKIHYLKTGLKPGGYYDFDTRILHGLFNELVDFVEIELSHLSKWSTNKKYKFKNGRCIEAAYDYFDWSTNLKYDESYGTSKEDEHYGRLTDQAKNMRKVKKLYEWWKNTRPNRVNPYSDPQLGDIEDICDNKKHKNKKKLYEQAYQKEIDQQNEDTKMLIELIKIRDSLWT
jgi:hypothetical protein